MPGCVSCLTCSPQYTPYSGFFPSPIYTGEGSLFGISGMLNRPSITPYYTDNMGGYNLFNQVPIPGNTAADMVWPVVDTVNAMCGSSSPDVTYVDRRGRGTTVADVLNTRSAATLSQPVASLAGVNMLSGVQDQQMLAKMAEINRIAGTPEIIELAKELNEEITNGWTITRSGRIENLLKDLSPEETAAVELVYDGLFGNPQDINLGGTVSTGGQPVIINQNLMPCLQNPGLLRRQIRSSTYSELQGGIFDLLNKGADVDPRVGAITCKDEMQNDFWKSVPIVYTKTIDKLLNKNNKDYNNIMKSFYEENFGTTMQKDVRNTYWWLTGEYDILDKLNNKF